MMNFTNSANTISNLPNIQSNSQQVQVRSLSPFLQTKVGTLKMTPPLKTDVVQISKPSNQQTKDATENLTIGYVNDYHGNTDCIAGMGDGVKNLKRNFTNMTQPKSASFILSAGDNVSGGDEKKNSMLYDYMINQMGVSLSAVGNHEMDGTLDGFIEAIKGKNLTFVATNVKFDDEDKVRQYIKKSEIKEQNGSKYGFIGAMPQDFLECTKKDAQKGLKVDDFNATVQDLQQEIDNLKSQGIDKIILLSHSGYDTDKQLASALDGVDIIIGGHSHTVVENAKLGENVVISKSGEPVVITQTGENGNFYGILNVTFQDGKITKVGNNLIESTNKKKSPVIETLKNKFLGESPKIGNVKQIDPMPKNRRNAPCAWTDWLADSMKADLGTDIAIVNAANTRKVPQEGTLTQRDIVESSPMKNKLLKTTVTQKQVVDAIKDASLKTMNNKDGEPGLLHFSGIEYKIDKQGNLLEASYVDKNGQKTKIDINNPSKDISYSACYDNFVAKTDGEYPALGVLEDKQQTLEYDKDETMIKYLSNRKDKDNLVIVDDHRLEIV